MKRLVWIIAGILVLSGIALAQTRRSLPFSIAAVIPVDVGVEIPGFDIMGRIVSNAHIGMNSGMFHLGYRGYFLPQVRPGGVSPFWGVGVLVPFNDPALLLRYNYLSLGIEYFVTYRLYIGGQVSFSPGMFYYVNYEMPKSRGAMDMSPLFIVVPTIYIGYTFF